MTMVTVDSSARCLGSVFTIFFEFPYEFRNIVEYPASANFVNAELSKSNRTMCEFPPHRKNSVSSPIRQSIFLWERAGDYIVIF
jgi:hypothetical protein